LPLTCNLLALDPDQAVPAATLGRGDPADKMKSGNPQCSTPKNGQSPFGDQQEVRDVSRVPKVAIDRSQSL